MRGMRVVVDGRVERLEDFDPGRPLLHSRYEWGARYRNDLLREVLAYTIVLVVVMSAVSIALYLVSGNAGLATMVFVLATACYIVAEFWSRGLTVLGTAPGLYEVGLVHPRGFVIPYEEITEFQLRKGPVPLLTADRLVLTPRSEHRLVDYSEWELETRLLGVDGQKVLRERISGAAAGDEGQVRPQELLPTEDVSE